MSIKYVVFDAYGTLFDVNSAVRGLADRVGPRADELSEIWRTKQLQYTWLRSLMQDYKNLWGISKDALRVAFEACHISDDQLFDDLMQAYLQLDAYVEVSQLLQSLRRAGMQTAILSNGTSEMLQSATKSAGIHDLLDCILSVDSLEMYKPDPRVYALATKKFNCQPSEICFVSSNAWDVAGAGQFGFNVAWINRLKQVPERLGKAPRWVLDDLSALPGCLR